MRITGIETLPVSVGAGYDYAVLIVLVGSLARALGLPVPELVLVEVDPVLGRAEPDQEVQDLLRASGGLNLGMDYLPGALGFDPVVHVVDPYAGRGGRVWAVDQPPSLLMNTMLENEADKFTAIFIIFALGFVILTLPTGLLFGRIATKVGVKR